MRIPREEARLDPFIAEAETDNRASFENQTFTATTGNADPNDALRSLRDGESKQGLTDHWVVGQSDVEAVRQVLRSGYPAGPDAYAQFGRQRMRSDATFDVKRAGDSITVSGTVTHDAGDDYDFHTGRSGDLVGAKDLQDAGRGMPFRTERTWTEEFEGTVRILGENEDGLVLGAPRFIWRDVGE